MRREPTPLARNIEAAIAALSGPHSLAATAQNCGMSVSRLTAIVRGYRNPTSTDIALIATALGCTVPDLLFWGEPKKQIAFLESVIASLQQRPRRPPA